MGREVGDLKVGGVQRGWSFKGWGGQRGWRFKGLFELFL